MARKYNLKYILFFSVVIIIITSLFHFYAPIFYKKSFKSQLNCVLFNQSSQCLLHKNDVFLPSLEIIEIFDIHGYFDGGEKIYYLRQNNYKYKKDFSYKYNTKGKYLFFNDYKVELRPQVRLLSTTLGLPITGLWNVHGYLYPIHIAQFGLSHYSKWIILKEKHQILEPLDLLVISSKSTWDLTVFNNKKVKMTKTGLFFFSTLVITEEVLLNLKSFMKYGNELDINDIKEYVHRMSIIDSSLPELYIIGSEWIIGSAVHVKIKNKSVGDIHVVYVCGDFFFHLDDLPVFVYAISKCKSIKLVRNIYIDIIKLIPENMLKMYPFMLKDLRKSSIEAIVIYGQGKISTFKICNQFSYEKFLIAANWFLKNQDKKGGWTVNVTRDIYMYAKSEPAQYSAMTQGHGISLLVRAFHVTNNIKYMDAASKALSLFEISTVEDGIRTNFLGQDDLVWYEEYPIQPYRFVLNGFIYSLFGLIDYKQISPSVVLKQKAEKLLKSGLKSLKVLLPLFDSGYGSFHDLRHVISPTVSVHNANKHSREVTGGPNRARWELHIMHIEQLLYLIHFTNRENKIFIDVTERFIKYLKGYHSTHN